MAPSSRRPVQRHVRRLEQNGAGAAHRVQQRRAGIPTGQQQQPGGEVFLERRRARLALEAALEQRLAAGVEIKGHRVRREEGVHRHVGRRGVDARALMRFLAEAVADRVLDLQGDEVETFQRRVLRADLHCNGLLDVEPVRPRQVERGTVDVLLLAVAGESDLAQDAGGDARGQVDAHFGRRVGHEQHARRHLAHHLGTGGGQFGFEQRLKSARAGGEMAGRRQRLALGTNGMRRFRTTRFGFQTGLSKTFIREGREGARRKPQEVLVFYFAFLRVLRG